MAHKAVFAVFALVHAIAFPRCVDAQLAKLTTYTEPGRYCGYNAGRNTIAVRSDFPLQCGSCLKLTCNNAVPLYGKTDYCATDGSGNLKSLIVTIDNQCPTCDGPSSINVNGQSYSYVGLDINAGAFNELASGSVGYINVWWEVVMCPEACSGPINIEVGKWEDYYQEFRIRYAATPVARMGIADQSGSDYWVLPRDPAWPAQFINNGRKLVGRLTIGLVDIYGSEIKMTGFTRGGNFPANFQFPRIDGNGVNRCAYLGRRLNEEANSTMPTPQEALDEVLQEQHQEDQARKFLNDQDNKIDYDAILHNLMTRD